MVNIPEFVGDQWLNSDPLSKQDLEGKVVLIDFWTYTCVNCLRTMPYIKKWWDKYKEQDFVMIGIHTPEFEFEKNEENVKRAIKDLGIEWPILIDNDFVNWNSFGNRYWPAKYLVNKEGKIVYSHFGEGQYAKTEAAIQELLKKGNDSLELPDLTQEEAHHACFKPTPETYCGYSRGRISNFGGYFYDQEGEYELPDTIAEHTFALKGRFISTPEYIESVDTNSELHMRFHATEVNLVIHPVNEDVEIKVHYDDQAVPEETRGKDLDSGSIIHVRKPMMYKILKSQNPHDGVLKLKAHRGNFRAYAFTFSGCY